MEYKVIYRFADLQDSKYVYEVGDIYPREGSKPTPERIEALASGKNKIGKPLIEEVVLKKPEVAEETTTQEEVEPIAEEKPKPKRGRRKKADSEE